MDYWTSFRILKAYIVGLERVLKLCNIPNCIHFPSFLGEEKAVSYEKIQNWVIFPQEYDK